MDMAPAYKFWVCKVRDVSVRADEAIHVQSYDTLCGSESKLDEE